MEETIKLNGIKHKLPISREEMFKLNPGSSLIIIYPPGEFEIENDALLINETQIIAGAQLVRREQ